MCNQVFSFQGPTCINTTRISSKFFSLQNPKKSDKKKSLIKKQTIKTKTIEQANENKRRTTKENFRTEILSIRKFFVLQHFFLAIQNNNKICNHFIATTSETKKTIQALFEILQKRGEIYISSTHDRSPDLSFGEKVSIPSNLKKTYQVLMTDHLICHSGKRYFYFV